VRNDIVQEQAKQDANVQPSLHAESGIGAARLAENPLSEREMEVANLLVTGATNNEIAEQLVISPHTVKVHLRNIYEKLEVSSRTEASMLLLQQGWMVLPGVETLGPAVDAEPSPPPDPLPLANTLGSAFAWQPIYLAAAVVLVLCLLLLPPLVRGSTSALSTLLTDRGATIVAQPIVDVMPRWQLQTPLPAARSRFALVAVGAGDLYAIGGEGRDATLFTDVDVYDLEVNEWRAAAALPVPLSNLTATAWQEMIFVAGGTSVTSGDDAMSHTLSQDLWRYEIEADRWQAAGTLPLPLAGANLLTHEDALYLLGGWDGEIMHDEVWRIDLPVQEPVAASDWQLVTRMAAPHAFGGAVAVDGVIYVAGGYDGHRELAVAQRYDVAADRWEDLPPLFTPRSGLHLLYDGLAIFAVGGGWTQPVNTLERFDPATQLWSHFPSPIAEEWRNLGAAASQGGYLYLIGGWSNSYLNTHLHYQSSFRMFLPSTRNSSGDNDSEE
jgi:DNA-binding CsgD family transcriptional regulator